MTPETCDTTVTGLAPTGIPAGIVLAAVLVGLIALAIGALLLSQGRSHGRVVALTATALALGIVALLPATAAHAERGSVSYSEGCTLIAVTDVQAPADRGALLPGEDVVVLTTRVSNPTAATVRIDAAGDVAGPLREFAETRTVVDGTDSLTGALGPGAVADIALVVTVPATVDDRAQRTSGTPVLTITATQR